MKKIVCRNESITAIFNAMEDSFRVRLEKAFGSLPIPSSSSLWSLTEQEIDNTPSSNRTHKPKPKPYSSSSSSSTSRVQLENDLHDLDDDDDDDEEPPRGPPSRPPDYDDEQWQIRSGIGQDCTLDFEEEEDQYDKVAIGKENKGDDRVYMKDINDDGVEISSSSVFPTSFRDFVRDPRANHLAAKIRLKQDDEAAKKIDALHVSEEPAPGIGGGGGGGGGGDGDGINPKSILKSKDNPSEPRPQKRVRFDSECDDRSNDDDDSDDGHGGTRDVRMKISSMEVVTASAQAAKAQEFDAAVPDYVRNPSRYTRYTFDDSPSDMDDRSNKEACMSFLSQLKAKGTGSEADEALDDLPSVTFIPKKKSGDANMHDSEMVSKQKLDIEKEATNRRAFPVGIAAGDSENSDVCAMEEDEPEVKKSPQKSNRKYRKKTQEELEEPIL